MIRFHLHGIGEFNSTRRIGPAVWPHFDLLFIHDGRVSLRLRDGDEIEITGGQCVLIYPHTPFRGHSLTASSRASVQHFGIDRRPPPRAPFDRLAERRDGFELYSAAAGRAVEPDVHRALQLAVAADEGSPLLHEMRVANLTLILAGLSQPLAQRMRAAGDEAFDAVINWAQENLHRGSTVDDLARRAGLSCSHFRSLFTQHLGRSPGAFLMDLRLREASRLLRETRMPIKQIARRVGYGDIANFHRAFQRRDRLTPARYRARYSPTG